MRQRDGLRGTTDVTGFGFLDALVNILGDATAVIHSSKVPRFSSVPKYLEAQAWSSLLDENMARMDPVSSYVDLPEVATMSKLLNDPQTSGGLLAIMDRTCWANVTGLLPGCGTVVGEIVNGREVKVTIVQ